MKTKREGPLWPNPVKSEKFFFNMMKASKTGGKCVLTRMRHLSLTRNEVAKRIVKDKSSGINSIETALEKIRELIDNRNIPSENFILSIKKILRF